MERNKRDFNHSLYTRTRHSPFIKQKLYSLMPRLVLSLLFLLVAYTGMAQQDRWGISVGSGVQNALLPFRERSSAGLRAPVTLTFGRVFMMNKPDLAIWFYLRAERSGTGGTTGFGYRVSPSFRFGDRNTTRFFADVFFGLGGYASSSRPVRNERASGTFFSLGLSHGIARNHALDASVGLFNTVGPLGKGFGFQPSVAYTLYLHRKTRPLRSPKPKRFRSPSRCPESFD